MPSHILNCILLNLEIALGFCFDCKYVKSQGPIKSYMSLIHVEVLYLRTRILKTWLLN